MSSTKKWSRKAHSIWKVNDEDTPVLTSNNTSNSYRQSYDDDDYIEKFTIASNYRGTCRFQTQVKKKLNDSYIIVSSPQVERKFQNKVKETPIQKNVGIEISIQKEDSCSSEFINSLNNEENVCPICLKPFHQCVDLVITTCGHLSCRKCLERWIYETYSDGFKCTICRQNLDLKDVITPKI